MNIDTARNYLDRLLSGRKRKPKIFEKYARFNRRMLAVTIDSFILLLFMPFINALAPVNTDSLKDYTIDPHDPRAGQHLILHMMENQQFLQSWIANFFMQMVFWCVYSAVFWHFFSATPGKILLRMKIIDAKSEGRINDLQIALRSFGYILSTVFFCLGFIWINFNKRRRGWHDYLGETVVINLPLPPLLSWKKLLPWKKQAGDDQMKGSHETPVD